MTSADIKTQQHPSESAHYYSRDGQQVLEIDGKVPDFRNKLVRKHQLAPGQSAIVRMKAAHGLTRWLQQEAIRCALTLPRKPDEPEADWLDRILDDSKQTASKAADVGTQIHKAVEQFIRGEPHDLAFDAHIGKTLAALEALPGSGSWQSEQVRISPLGVGSKLDLFNDHWIVDMKGTEKLIDDLKTWDEHHMQLGFYQSMLPGRRCAILYVDRNGKFAHPIEVPQDKLERGYKQFRHCVGLWRLEKNYVPGWATDHP